MATTLAACTAAAPRRQVALPAGVAPSPTRIVESLARRDEDLSRFRAQAKLDYRSPTQGFRSTQVVAVRAPSSIRIEVMHPFGVSYTVATDGDSLFAYDRREKVFYSGRATTASFRRFLGVPLGAGELADLLRGLPPRLAPAKGGAVEPVDHGWLWRRDLAGGGVLEVVLDETALEPAAVRLTGHPGQGDVEAAFSEYRDVAGVRVAHRIDVRFDDGATLVLEYRSVQRDTKLPPDAFHLAAPAGARVEGIDAAAADGAAAPAAVGQDASPANRKEPARAR